MWGFEPSINLFYPPIPPHPPIPLLLSGLSDVEEDAAGFRAGGGFEGLYIMCNLPAVGLGDISIRRSVLKSTMVQGSSGVDR